MPNKEGTQWLYLSLTAHFEVNGKETMRSVKTFEKIIEVEVSPVEELTQFITNHWQWLWATFVAPLAYWVWKRINRKKSNHKVRTS